MEARADAKTSLKETRDQGRAKEPKSSIWKVCVESMSEEARDTLKYLHPDLR